MGKVEMATLEELEIRVTTVEQKVVAFETWRTNVNAWISSTITKLDTIENALLTMHENLTEARDVIKYLYRTQNDIRKNIKILKKKAF